MARNVLNAAEMKWQNQKYILRLLHNSPCSRAELARQTGLTRSAISIIADELISYNYIMKGEPILGKVGRKSFVLQLNPHRFYIIGINISRTTCRIGIINFCGEILYSTRFKILKTSHDTLDHITHLLKEHLTTNAYPGELLGIGITAPGPLDTSNGRILNPPNFKSWSFINITDYFQEEFDCPVVLENNSNATALAEKFYGSGGQYKNYVELNIDSGVGCGVILDGLLYKGSSGFSNDFGHMSINFLGEPCQCGNIGCAELYASVPNILRYARQLGYHFSDWKDVVDSARLKDTRAIEIIEKEADYLSLIIVNIMNILDVDAVIIAGDIAYHSDLLVKLLRTQVNQRILARVVKQIDIISSTIVDDAPVLSSANLMFEYFFNNEMIQNDKPIN